MAEAVDLRTRHVLPIGTVMLLTALTARQIRYYEAQHLVSPGRTAGNHRAYSLHDVDVLLAIKSQLADGFSIADIHNLMHPRHQGENSDEAVRQMLRDELLQQSRFAPDAEMRQGFGFQSRQ